MKLFVLLCRNPLLWTGSALCLLALGSCIPNNPYRSDEADKNYSYDTFGEPPKHLDPAMTYSDNETRYTMQIYEPPLQYHYLKRPYELEPLTARSVPEPTYYDSAGQVLAGDPPGDQVARAVYRIELKPGILYQSHPCFARAPDGQYLYRDLEERQMAGIGDIGDFSQTGTRELLAADYVYQIKRLAHPQLDCPIFSIMAKYIAGLDDLSQQLQGALTRRQSESPQDPIWLDLDDFPLAGARATGPHTFEIELKRKYPQFVYWLTMTFFAPVPREADWFFAQAPLVERNLSLDNRPVGTGAYRMETYIPHREIVLAKNENYRAEKYPEAGEAGDREKGLLADAGKQLPFIERAIYKLEKESIPRWNKFIQGYYDETLYISSEVFDQVVELSDQGGLELSPTLEQRGVQLLKSTSLTTYYYGFNMLDDVVGGYAPEKQKLRQAISIAIDMEESIQIFMNGRGIPAHDLLPPGMFGHRPGRRGINPYIYDWDAAASQARRKSIDAAKGLLAEAGYPGGKDRQGKPLSIYFDTGGSGAAAKARQDWLRKQFAKIDIDLQVRQTDYNRFQDKVHKGNVQLFWWGWGADYPDPENFLFLLYGPTATATTGGPNTTNYDNPEFNQLFLQIESMANGPQRQALIDRMLEIARRDAPWIWGFHPVSFGLYHQWYANAKPQAVFWVNDLKYKRLDPAKRQRARAAWNQPIWWPLGLALLAVALLAVPAFVSYRRREREVAAP